MLSRKDLQRRRCLNRAVKNAQLNQVCGVSAIPPQPASHSLGNVIPSAVLMGQRKKSTYEVAAFSVSL